MRARWRTLASRKYAKRELHLQPCSFNSHTVVQQSSSPALVRQSSCSSAVATSAAQSVSLQQFQKWVKLHSING